MDKDHIELIKKLYKEGHSLDEIKREFISNGWAEEKVDILLKLAREGFNEYIRPSEDKSTYNNIGAFNFNLILFIIFIIAGSFFVYLNQDLFFKQNIILEEKQVISKETKLVDLYYEEVIQCKISNDIKKVACSSYDADKRWRLIYNTSKTQEYNEIVYDSIIFSPDSKRLVYIAKERDESFLILNGQRQNPYDEILYPIFSPDSDRLAYTVKKDDFWHLVIDKEEGDKLDSPVYAIFSENKDEGYIKIENGKEYFILGEDKQEWDYILKTSLLFSGSAKDYIYAAQNELGWYVVYNGVIDGPYIAILDTAISIDGKSIAFNANIDGEWYLITAKEKLGPFEYVGDIAFNPVNNDFAYCKYEDSKWNLAYNNLPIKSYKGVYAPKFSLDGKYLAYVAQAESQLSLIIIDLSEEE